MVHQCREISQDDHALCQAVWIANWLYFGIATLLLLVFLIALARALQKYYVVVKAMKRKRGEGGLTSLFLQLCLPLLPLCTIIGVAVQPGEPAGWLLSAGSVASAAEFSQVAAAALQLALLLCAYPLLFLFWRWLSKPHAGRGSFRRGVLSWWGVVWGGVLSLAWLLPLMCLAALAESRTAVGQAMAAIFAALYVLAAGAFALATVALLRRAASALFVAFAVVAMLTFVILAVLLLLQNFAFFDGSSSAPRLTWSSYVLWLASSLLTVVIMPLFPLCILHWPKSATPPSMPAAKGLQQRRHSTNSSSPVDPIAHESVYHQTSRATEGYYESEEDLWVTLGLAQGS